MNCPKCDKPLTNGMMCPSCGCILSHDTEAAFDREQGQDPIRCRLLRACELGHDAIIRGVTPGSHRQRDLQYVLDELAGAIGAAGGRVSAVPEMRDRVRRG